MQRLETLCNSRNHYATAGNIMQQLVTLCNSRNHYATAGNIVQQLKTLCNSWKHYATAGNMVLNSLKHYLTGMQQFDKTAPSLFNHI